MSSRRLEGTWNLIASEQDGMKADPNNLKKGPGAELSGPGHFSPHPQPLSHGERGAEGSARLPDEPLSAATED